MAWRRPGDKPLSEPMMICLLTHICVTRPQWVNMTRVQCFMEYAHSHVFFCCVMAILSLVRGSGEFIYSYPTMLLYWHWSNQIIAPNASELNWKIYAKCLEPKTKHNNMPIIICKQYYIFERYDIISLLIRCFFIITISEMSLCWKFSEIDVF